jgi:hypothetical protein
MLLPNIELGVVASLTYHGIGRRRAQTEHGIGRERALAQ